MPYVVSGAKLMCPFGMATSVLNVLPTRTQKMAGVPMANVMDFTPLVNIPPFGACSNPAYPPTAAATAAAMGALTPMPCVPAITAPWTPGSPNVMVQGMPALTPTCTCQCMFGGVITIMQDGQIPVRGYTTSR